MQIRQENPKIAKDTGVMRTTLDAVYEVFTMPREESGLQVRPSLPPCPLLLQPLCSPCPHSPQQLADNGKIGATQQQA